LVEESIIISTGDTIFFVKPDKDAARLAFKRGEEGLIWTQQNKFFRSSVWNAAGHLVSAGFPKFVNWGENVENFPVPQSIRDATIVEKLDGSCLILSKYNGHFIIRTRNTLDASSLKNGHEIEIFRRTILPNLNAYNYGNTWSLSWLFEWTSPEQRVIIDYGDKPNWSLIGIIDHSKYELIGQEILDQTARMLKLPRPKTYSFRDITHEELIKEVDKWKGLEGVVVYTGNGQVLHKVKSAWHLALHRMKTELGSRDKVIKVWFQMGKPAYKEFHELISKHFDYELAQQVLGDISIICDAWKKVNVIVESFKKFIQTRLLTLGDPQNAKIRKEMADVVISSYGKTNRANYIFTLLDGKELDDDALEKLLYQCIKNR
jgi:hypothetical protein